MYKPPVPGGISSHMDHCIEKYVSLTASSTGLYHFGRQTYELRSLRQALICQGDMALYTYEWLPEQDEPNVVAGMQHVCVDFTRVMEWAEERSYSIYDGLLQSPYRGELVLRRQQNNRLTITW